ncbi:MAG: hypothetical protein KAW14_02810 [Candidatus Aegiribacteria sp.]|nr:hypothetical protein [Candidatus Aegiribacteria sp.]
MLEKLKSELGDAALGAINRAAIDIPAPFQKALQVCVTHSDHLEISLLACAASEWCGHPRATGMPVAVAALMLRAGISVHLTLPGFKAIHDSIPELLEKQDDVTAILAGDALLALAMEHLAENGGRHAARLLSEAVRATGVRGMLAGLSLKLDQQEEDISVVPDGRSIWEITSGQIARFAAQGGALLAGASDTMLDDAAQIGLLTGRAWYLAEKAKYSSEKRDERNPMFEARTLMEQAETITGHGPEATLFHSIMYLTDFFSGT